MILFLKETDFFVNLVMMRTAVVIMFLAFLAVILPGCKKDPVPQTSLPETELTFNYKAYLNDYPLVFNSSTFATNQNGDSVNVSKFNYYISNIKLVREDGVVFAEPESYHMISHENPASTDFVIKDLPTGSYYSMEFMIGVDSARNCSGIQKDALDPSNYMFWNWNTGYIFMKLEGKAKTALNPVETTYAMHTGGYKLPYNCIRNVKISLPGVIIADKTKPAVYFNVLVDEIFKTPVTIDMDTYIDVAGGKKASIVATNYADMFVLDHVSN
jgi:hypothetical protein